VGNLKRHDARTETVPSHDDQSHPYHHSWSAYLFPDNSKGYDISTPRMSSFTQHSVDRRRCLTRDGVFVVHKIASEHEIILTLSAKVGIKSASASVFGAGIVDDLRG
jgi:hypothetical protein